MRKIISAFVVIGLYTIAFSSDATAAFGYIKRGLKHCTGVCDKQDVCSLENDEQYRWCLKNCAHKINTQQLCAAHFPVKMRPILPYEQHTGAFSTNEVSPQALEGLDHLFIRQTQDKKRLVGTAQKVLLVREQYVNGKNIQKLAAPEREKLGKTLFLNFFKTAPEVIQIFEKTGAIPDDKMTILFKEVRSEILNKWRRENKA
jgi:hypothetical protein